MNPAVANTPLPRPAQPRKFWMGVELGPLVIRAAIYDSSLRYLGKIKLSTKLERGPEAVMARVARCIRYTADECDLEPGQIQGVGVGVPGHVDPDTGQVIRASTLDWSRMPLGAVLQDAIELPVAVENNFQLGGLGILSTEIPLPITRFAALFPGPRIGGAILQREPGPKSPVENEFAARENVFHVMPQEDYRHFRGKDFKRALRKGNQQVEEFVRQMAARTGEIARDLLEKHGVEMIAIGGGVIEEMRAEILEIIQRTAGAPAGGKTVEWFASQMGDYATLAGGAALATRRFTKSLR